MARRYDEDGLFTMKQLRLIESVIKYNNLKLAAENIGISYPAAKQVFYRLRKEYREAKSFEREIGPKIEKVLATFPACWNCKYVISRAYKNGTDFVECVEAGAYVETKTLPMCSLFEWRDKKNGRAKGSQTITFGSAYEEGRIKKSKVTRTFK
ncbi:MAG: hypothetical protein ABSG25_11945 [Bryobacteraceae bacterium]|jgi:hypothetical protein